MVVCALRAKYPLALLLEVSGLSKALYYYHLNNSTYLERNKDIIEKLKECFEKSHCTYGYRRLTICLRKSGITINHKKVLKLMNLLNMHPLKKKRKKYSSYNGDVGKKFPDLIQRNFKASKPNEKWMTDVTEFKTNEGKLYLSPFIDAYNQEIVGYSISVSPNMELIIESLNNSMKNQKIDFGKGLIIHSDQGWQYQNNAFTSVLEKLNVSQSMSRKGNCDDNGLMEGFFGLLKNEMYYGNEKEFKTLDSLKKSIERYIDFYNHERIKVGLNGLSPLEYKKINLEGII